MFLELPVIIFISRVELVYRYCECDSKIVGATRPTYVMFIGNFIKFDRYT